MFKIIAKVEGMKCGHCANHVDEAIREAFKVKKVNSSHEAKETVILSKEDLDNDKIKAVIEELTFFTLNASRIASSYRHRCEGLHPDRHR